LAKFAPILLKVGGCSREVLAKSSLASWRIALTSLREERVMLEELEAHRNGRGQLIQQYRDLEAEYRQECQSREEGRARIVELGLAVEQLQQEQAWINSRMQEMEHESEKLKSRNRSLEDQHGESQDRCADLRRELRSQSEKVRRLEQQLEIEQQEKTELHESLLKTERINDKLQGEGAGREADNARAIEALHAKDMQIAQLEEQLNDMRGVIVFSHLHRTLVERRRECHPLCKVWLRVRTRVVLIQSDLRLLYQGRRYQTARTSRTVPLRGNYAA